MQTHHLTLPAPVPLTFAVCADFHSSGRPRKLDGILRRLRSAAPDAILCPGDWFNNTDEWDVRHEDNANAFDLLCEVSKIAPTFFALGNHDRGLTPDNRRQIEEAGATVLTNEWVRFRGVLIGGSACVYASEVRASALRTHREAVPHEEFFAAFAREEGYKILLCHHPEQWERLIRGRGIDLTVSGHAHGGQWRVFGRGVWAPGQGLFPRYTSGIYPFERSDGGREYLVVSRGMTNSVRFIPRFFNPCEIPILDLTPEAVP